MRTNFKSKNFRPHDDPTAVESSSGSEDDPLDGTVCLPESEKNSDDSSKDPKKLKEDHVKYQTQLIDMSRMIDNPSSRPTVDE